MSNDIDIKLLGERELMDVLTGLEYKVQHRVLKKVVNDAANVLVKPTRAVIPIRKTKMQPSGQKWHPPGTGKKSIGKKAGRSTKNAVVFVGPRTKTNNYHTDGWYLRFWEKGTRKWRGTNAILSVYRSKLKDVENHMSISLKKIFEREMRKVRK
jgi:hypothetical protein